jgi:predicted nucleic acid-binding protein
VTKKRKRSGLKPRHVFLDTGIFVAALDRSDQWHPQASALFAGTRGPLCTSLLVVSEAYSWFLHRMGEESARRFQSFLAALPGLEIFEATRAHHSQVLETLDRYRGTKLTYVDASSIAFLSQHGIRIVWGTDRHLAIGGAKVEPA